MAYFLNLFKPETWSIFRERGSSVNSFTKGLRSRAHASIKPGGIFVCYLADVKRWCGVLRIVSDAYDDDTPILGNPMPWVVHFKVEPIVILNPEHSIPTENDEIWYTLSITKDIEKGARGWGANFASSLRTINDSDGDFLVSCLKRQQQDESRIDYPLTDKERRRLQNINFSIPRGEVPTGDEEDDNAVVNIVDDPASEIMGFIAEAPEGKTLTQIHIVRERNRKLVQRKKESVRQKTGRLVCEACKFDFAEKYGERGEGFIECHHTKPLRDLEPGSKTHLKDLVLLCSNCHSMIHAKQPWLKMKDLTRVINLNACK